MGLAAVRAAFSNIANGLLFTAKRSVHLDLFSRRGYYAKYIFEEGGFLKRAGDIL